MLGELRKLDSLVQKKKKGRPTDTSMVKSSNVVIPGASTLTNEKKPCSYCEKKGFPGRCHPEAIYGLKLKDVGTKPDNIKSVNNVALQKTLNEFVPDQKN